MSKDLNTDPLEAFMARVRTMAQSRSRELRMTSDEAVELSASLSQVLARLVATYAANDGQVLDVEIDGGTF